MTTQSRTKFPTQTAAADPQLAELLEQASQAISYNDFATAGKLLMSACNRAGHSLELHLHAALVLRQSGNLPLAEKYLLKAHHLDARSLEPLHNLAILATEQRDLEKAKEYLHRALVIDPENAGTLNDLAVLEEQSENDPAAQLLYERGIRLASASKRLYQNYFEFCSRTGNRESFQQACTLYRQRWGQDAASIKWCGEQDTAAPQATQEGIRAKNSGSLRLAFFAAHRMFIDPVIAHLSQAHQVKVLQAPTIEEMRDALKWADLAWFEWCDQLLIQATKLPKTCKIICRLHSYEVFTEMPRQVDWTKVDHLVFVNRSVQELMAYNTSVTVPQSVIFNGVDTQRFDIPLEKKYGKRICSIGYVNYKKNPALLLYCFKAIHDYDPGYTFHIAGEHQDPRIQVYFAHLLPKLNLPIQFDGWVQDIPAYLADKDFVISTSLFESFHYSIAEGMASGVLPLIHNWLGSEYLYPKEYLFTTPDDCLKLLQRLEQADRRRLGAECRQHIVENFDNQKQLAKIEQLIETVSGKPTAGRGR